MKYLGMIEGSSKKEYLSFTPQPVNKRSKMEVNHNHSEHTMAVQRSRFLSIDDDISNENLQKKKAKFYDNPDQ